MTVVAALDIGGTKTAAALVRGAQVIARTQAPTPAAEGPDAVLDTAAALVRALGGAPERFGAGAPGIVDPDTGVVFAATSSLAGWTGTDVRDGLASRLGFTGAVCNDVHAFLLGEVAYGAAAGATDAIGVAVGTGIGGGVVTDGRLLTGVHGAAAHLGHVVVPQATGLPCPCGATGHVEAVASGPAIAAAYTGRTGAAVALPDVVARARAGDRAAAEVLSVAGEALGAVLGSLVNVFDPSVVVVGGGAAVPEVLTAAEEALGRAVMPALRGIPVSAAMLGRDAAMIGAAELAVRA